MCQSPSPPQCVSTPVYTSYKHTPPLGRSKAIRMYPDTIQFKVQKAALRFFKFLFGIILAMNAKCSASGSLAMYKAVGSSAAGAA